MTTQLVSAPAAPSTLVKPIVRPRAFVPEIEFKYNIEKAKRLMMDGEFNEVADILRDNTFAPDFLIADITRYAPFLTTQALLVDFADFVRYALTSENLERRALKMSAMIRAMARFSSDAYFKEKVSLFRDIKTLGAKVPKEVLASCENIEASFKSTLTRVDWLRHGYKVTAENVGQVVYAHPELQQSITVYKTKVAPASEAEKAKAREHREGERRARQLERAAMCPKGAGGGGNNQSKGKRN
jgi:hypothetical protein